MQVAPEFFWDLIPRRFFSKDNFENLQFTQKMKLENGTEIQQRFNLVRKMVDILIEQGIEQPTKLQAQSIKFIQHTPYQNFGILAPAGAGKTMVYLISVMQRAYDNRHDQYLILEPTKLLAEQVYKYVKIVGDALGLKTAVYIKAVDIPAVNLLPNVIVSTPGMAKQMIKVHFISKNIGIIVLDEIDVVIKSSGLIDQYLQVLRSIKLGAQVLLFGRDLNKEEKDRINIAFDNPTIVDNSKEMMEVVSDTTREHIIIYDNEEERNLSFRKLVNALQANIKTIVFARTNEIAFWLYEQVKTQPKIALLSKDYQLDYQSEIGNVGLGDKMLGIIDRFRANKTMIMIATDIMAVGINISDLILVVNYDMPLNEHKELDNSIYNRRNGRVARFGKSGHVINFIREDEFQKITQSIFNDHVIYNEIDVIENIGNFVQYLIGIYMEFNGKKQRGKLPFEYQEP